MKRIDRLQGKDSQRQRLMGFYELARLIRRAAGGRCTYDDQTADKLAKAIGWSSDQVRRVRTLAIAYPAFEQFKELV